MTAISRPTARAGDSDAAKIEGGTSQPAPVHSRWPTPPPPLARRPLPPVSVPVPSARTLLHRRQRGGGARARRHSVSATPQSAQALLQPANSAATTRCALSKRPLMARRLSAAVPWRWARAAPRWAAALPPSTKHRSRWVRSAPPSVNTSAALGSNSAVATGSVALGAGSLTDRVDAVSVGAQPARMTRQIAASLRSAEDTDAVNVGQLKGVAAVIRCHRQAFPDMAAATVMRVHWPRATRRWRPAAANAIGKGATAVGAGARTAQGAVPLAATRWRRARTVPRSAATRAGQWSRRCRRGCWCCGGCQRQRDHQWR